MYHLLVRDILFVVIPQIKENVWILRIIVFPAMIILPVLVALIIKKIAGNLVCINRIREDVGEK